MTNVKLSKNFHLKISTACTSTFKVRIKSISRGCIRLMGEESDYRITIDIVFNQFSKKIENFLKSFSFNQRTL